MAVKIINNNHGLTLVFFGGVAGGMGIAPFEFSRFSETLLGNKVFVTVDSQSWYSTGINNKIKILLIQ